MPAPITGDRGTIYAREGTPLAVSVRMYNLFADPAFIVDPGNEIKDLLKKEEELSSAADAATGSDKARLQGQLAALTKRLDGEKKYVDAARQELAAALAKVMDTTPGQVMGLIEGNTTRRDGVPAGSSGWPRRWTRRSTSGF